MSGWVKTEAEWFEQPDTEDLGADAVMLHLSALAYSGQHTTNGHVPRRALRRLYPVPEPDAAVAALVEADWWQPAEDGYQIVSWAKHILSEDEVERMKAQNRVRSERHRRHDRGDHSMCERCWFVRKHGNAVSNAVTNDVSDAPPDRTGPDRTEGEERRGEGETGGSTSHGGSASLRPPNSAPPPGEPPSAGAEPVEHPWWAAGPPAGTKFHLDGEEVGPLHGPR